MPVCRPWRCTRGRERGCTSPCAGAEGGQPSRPGGTYRVAAHRRGAARGACAMVADRAGAGDVRLARAPRGAASAAAAALAAAAGRRRGHGRHLVRVPHAVRPHAGDRAARAVLRAEAARNAHASRRRGGRAAVLLPDHHELLLYAEHRHRAGDGRRAAGDRHHHGRVQRAAAPAARKPAHGGPAARARGARGCGAVPALSAGPGTSLGLAAGRLRGHQRPQRHHVPGYARTPGAIGHHRVSRRVRGGTAAPETALLARTGALGFRRPHLAHGRY